MIRASVAAAVLVAWMGCTGGDASPSDEGATVFAEGVSHARQVVVTPSCDVYVAIADADGRRGGVLALRDSDGDGTAD